MDPPVNQRWGRSLEDYAASYGIAAAGQRDVVLRETEEKANRVKEAMYGQTLNARCPIPGAGNFLGADNITLPMLETVLKLAQSPHHLEFFADPVFLGGCIQFLAQIRPRGRQSPFSHELGYLCFRIIAIGIGVWILKVTENLNKTIENIEMDRKTEPLLVFSAHVSRSIQEAMLEVGGGAACDWIMGWRKTRGHMNPKPFLLPSDLRSLLGMLWEDRKLYLQAILTTYFPGLTGVMFVLWRYLDANPAIESAKPSELMIIPFCDLLWRTMLVATEDQLTPLLYINNLAHHTNQAHLWDESPKFVDSEDSRTILHAFNARLAPADLRLFKPLSLANIGALLQFVTGSAQRDSEDLFPALFRGTIECIWRGVEKGDLTSGEIIEVAGGVFASLSDVIEPLNHANQSSRTMITELVTELEKHDFLELLARLILLMEPGNTQSTFNPGVSRNTMFINNTSFLVATLAKVVPDVLLGYQFKERVDGWSKMEFKLSMFRLLGPSHPSDAHKHLHRECTELWEDLGKFLALGLWTRILLPYKCAYSRCPYEKGVLPVEFACTRCLNSRYCSAQCLTRDWTLGHGGGSHKQLCRPNSQVLEHTKEDAAKSLGRTLSHQ